jgi:long-subunit acyl-CoA synthetase (AMP-forming)
LGGIQSPANAAYSTDELVYQLKNSGAKALFTCVPLLETARAAAKQSGIPDNRIYILEVPSQVTGGKGSPKGMKTVDDFIREGKELDRLEPLNWASGDGAKKTAFLCYSSGTSGLPKGVMISHRNVIANTMQIKYFEKPYRDTMINDLRNQTDYTENVLGLLPMSHIYGLVVICHASVYRGDGVIVLPKFEFASTLQAIQDYKINSLFLVCLCIKPHGTSKLTGTRYLRSSSCLPRTNRCSPSTTSAQFGLSSQAQHPWAKRLRKTCKRSSHHGRFARVTVCCDRVFCETWLMVTGLTETCTVVCSTSPKDIWFGSSGSLLPGIECKIVTIEGNEITGYDQPGELLVKSPAVVLGYLNNDKANKETFQDGYMRTGDEAVIRKAPSGHEHVFIVDRIKELIKVKVRVPNTFVRNVMLTEPRATKSHPPSSKPIFLRIRT